MSKRSTGSLLLVLCCIACGPAVRRVNAAGDPGTAPKSASSVAPEVAERAETLAAPPAPLPRAPTVPAPHVSTLPGGPVLCSARRPDLALTVSSVRLPHGLSPEARVLVRFWLEEGLSAALKDDQLRQSVSLPSHLRSQWCEGTVACTQVDQQARDLVAVAQLLASPPMGSFYASRLRALRYLEEQQQRATWWTMEALAYRALLADPPTTSGRSRALSISQAELVKRLDKAVEKGQWALAGPLATEETTAKLAEAWSRSAGANSSQSASTDGEQSAREDDPTWNSAPRPVLLVHDSGERARASLAWPRNVPELHFLTAAHLAKEHVEQAAAGVSLDIHTEGSVFSLRLSGPIEEVLEAAKSIRQTWGATKERNQSSQRAFLTAESKAIVQMRDTALDPRCFAAPTQTGDIEERHRAFRQAMGNLNTPAIVYAGEEELLTPALSAPAEIAKVKNKTLHIVPLDE